MYKMCKKIPPKKILPDYQVLYERKRLIACELALFTIRRILTEFKDSPSCFCQCDGQVCPIHDPLREIEEALGGRTRQS